MRRRTFLGSASVVLLDLDFWPFNDDDEDDGSDELLEHGEDVDTPAGAHHARPTAGTHLVESGGAFAVKAEDFRKSTIEYDPINISFGNERTPNADRPVTVYAIVRVESTFGQVARATAELDPDGTGYFDVGRWEANVSSGGLASTNDVTIEQTFSWDVPIGGTYRLVNDEDPAGTNTISQVREVTW